MEAILILAGPYASCNATQLIWQKLCDEKSINLQIYDLTNQDGKRLAFELNIKSFPALVVNNEIIAVGHPDKESSENIMHALNL